MFKAKLIENDNYYKLRSKQLLLMLLPSIPFGLLVNFYQIPTWLTVVVIGLYILVIILLIRNQKGMNSVLGNKLIEIDEQEIRIKSKNGTEEEIVNLDDVEKIILKEPLFQPHRGNLEKNCHKKCVFFTFVCHVFIGRPHNKHSSKATFF